MGQLLREDYGDRRPRRPARRRRARPQIAARIHRHRTRQQMLDNSQFVDAKIQLFAKYGSIQWPKVGEYAVPRTLITK